MDDLKRRLRAHAHWGMTEEAADRIDALEAEVAQYREALKLCASSFRQIRAVLVSKHEHALATGALIHIAEALSGVGAAALTPAAPPDTAQPPDQPAAPKPAPGSA